MHVINVVVQAHYSCRFIKCAVTCFHLREASLRLAFDKYNTFVINLTFMGPCILRICNICPTRCNVTQFILSGNCSIYFGWYHHPSSVPTLPRYRQIAITVWQIPYTVDTVVCASDDGWWCHPKHVKQFPDKINCVTLHLVGYILEYRVTEAFVECT